MKEQRKEKKRILIAGIMGLAFVFGLMLAALSLTGCDNGGGGGGGDPIANHITGTWEAANEAITFSGSSFEKTENTKAVMKGIYTTDARSVTANITMTVKELRGDYLNEAASGGTFDNTKWYNEAQVKTINPSLTDSRVKGLFPTMEATVNDNTMTVGSTTYRKAGGHTHTYSSTWSHNETQHWKECTANDGAKKDTANHTGNPCTVCGYNSGSGGGGGGMTWTAVANNPFTGEDEWNNHFISVGYGGGMFVAGDLQARMATSTDGKNWTAVTNSPFGTLDHTSSNNISAITYGNGKFVAGSLYGRIATSTNGTTWTPVTTDAFNYTDSGNRPDKATINEIVYANNKFVAVGEVGRIAASTDGTTWTAVDNGIFGTGWNVSDVDAIAYGNDKFVAGGYRGIMATSTDGTNWTAVSNSPLGTSWIRAIAFGNGKFVAVCHDGKIATSTDGINWTAVTTNVFDYTNNRASISAIAFGGGRFVAVGTGVKMAYSTDGTSWTAVDVSGIFGTDDIEAIAFGGGTWVAVGWSGKIAYSTGN